MITITIDKPIKLPPSSISPMSGFVKFDYDSQIVDYIKTLGTRVYIPETKQWEVPITSVATICNKLLAHRIEILGELRFLQEVQSKLPANFKWHTAPFTHQIEGVLFGLQNNNFLLGDDQGLGKTHQIINLAIARKLSQGIKHCLIICGVNSTKYNWENEVALHSTEKAWVLGTRYTKKYPVKKIEGSSKDKLDDLNNLPNDFFLITNIEALRQLSHKQGNKTIYPISEKINQLCKSGEIGMIAFDEAHKCLDGASILSTDKGEITIEELVEKRIKCSVLSFNEDTGVFEYQPVTDYHLNFHFGEMIELVVQKGETKKILTVTPDHLIKTQRGWVPAENLQENDDIAFTNF